MSNNLNDSLDILVKYKLDDVGSKAAVTKQLNDLSEKAKINISFNLDQQMMQTLDGFSNALNKVTEMTKLKSDITRRDITITKENNKIIAEQEIRFNKLGQEIERIDKAIVDKGNKSRKSQLQTEAETQSIRKHIDELQNLGKEIQKITRLNSQGEVTGHTSYFKNNKDKIVTQVNTDEKGNLNSMKQVDSIQKEELAVKKLTLAQEELRKKLLELKAVSDRQNQTKIGQMNSQIGKATDIAQIDALVRKYNELKKAQDNAFKSEKFKMDNKSNIDSETKAVLHQIEVYQKLMAIKAQDATRKYKTLIDTNQLNAVMAQVNSLNKNTPNLNREMDKLNIQFKDLQSNARNSGLDVAARSALTFGEALKTALIKFPIWMIASTAFYASLGFFVEGIKYVNDLNKALTEISIVTNRSQAEVEKLGQEYHKLAFQMSVTTKEVAIASVEFYRQGLSQAEVMEKVAVTTQYAKISNLEFKESAKILTATVNSMGVSIERASDVFSFLGDATATGADEIGKAFQRVGGSAGALNLSFEKVASWIVVVSSRTREGAGTIGNSIKSLLARVENLQQNGFDEVDGTKINDVAKALATVDIALTDTDGQFRNFGEVLDELGGKWEGLDTRQKAYLSTTVAGTYQASRFKNLMEGYPQTISLYEKALDSAGTTQQKFSRYQEGTEASINRMKTAFTGLWQNTFESEGIRTIVNNLTAIISVISEVTKVTGLLPPVIVAATVAFLLFNKATTIDNGQKMVFILQDLIMKMRGIQFAARTAGIQTNFLSTSVAILGRSIKGLALFMAGAFLPIAGFIAVGLAISKITQAISASNAKQKEFAEYNKNIIESYTNHKTKVTELLKEYDKLNKKTSEGTLFESTEEETKYYELTNKIKELMPNLVKDLNAKGDAHLKNSEDIKKELAITEELIVAQKELNEAKSKKDFKALGEKRDSAIEDRDKKQAELDQIESWIERGGQRGFSLDDLKVKRASIKMELLRFKADINGATADIKDQVLKSFSEMLDLNGVELKENDLQRIKDIISDVDFSKLNTTQVRDFYLQLADAISIANKEGVSFKASKISDVFDSSKLSFDSKKMNDFTDGLKGINKNVQPQKIFNLKNSMNELTSSFSDTSKEVKPLNELLQDLGEGKKMTADEVMELALKYDEFADAIVVENGLLTINKDKIKEVRDAKIKSYQDQLKAEKDKLEAQEINLLQELGQYDKSIKGLEEVAKAKDLMSGKRKTLEGKINPPKTMMDADKGTGAFDFTNFSNNVEDSNFLQGLYKQELDYINESSIKLDEFEKGRERIAKLMAASQKGLEQVGLREEKGTKEPEEKAEAFDSIDVTDELIKSFNGEFVAREKIIASIERQIQLSKKQKDDNKTIKETNDLIDQQKKSVEDLEAANEKLRNEANLARKDNKQYDTVSWFDTNGEATLGYKEFLNTFAEKSKEVVNSSFSEKVKKEKIEALKDEQKQVQNLFEKLHKLKQAYGSNTEEIYKIIDAIDASKESIESITEKALEETAKALANALKEHKEVAKDIIDVYKDVNEALKDENIKAIEKSIAIEEKRHDKRMKHLDDEYNKLNDITDKEMKKIEDDSDKEDFNNELSKLMKEKSEIDKKIASKSLNNSKQAKAELIVLEKELSEKNIDIEKFKNERTKELRIGNLEDNLESKKKETDRLKEEEDIQYNNEKEKLEDLKKEREEYWKGVINDDRKNTKILNDIISGNFTDIEKDMEEFKKQIGSKSKTIGEGIKNNLIFNLEKVGKLMSNLKLSDSSLAKELGRESLGLDKIGEDGKPTSTIPTTKGYQAKNEEEQRMIDGMKENSKNWHSYPDARKILEGTNKSLGAKMGAEYIDGKWYKDGLPLYHEGGIVGGEGSPISQFANRLFNVEDHEQLAKLVKGEVTAPEINILKNFIPNVANMIGALGEKTSNAIQNIIFNIDKVIGTKEGAKDFVKVAINNLKAKGVIK